MLELGSENFPIFQKYNQTDYIINSAGDDEVIQQVDDLTVSGSTP